MLGRLVPLSTAVLAGALGSCGASSGQAGGSASSAVAATKAPACHPNGAHTLAVNSQARIFRLSQTVYGCAERMGKRTRLGSSGGCIGTDAVGRVALAGELAGYATERCGVDTGFSHVLVRRLSDGKALLHEAATTTQLGVETYVSVGSLVLRHDGAVAWIAVGSSIASHKQIREVRRASQAGQVLLDSSLSIATGSLRLQGSRLTWKHGQAVRSAELP